MEKLTLTPKQLFRIKAFYGNTQGTKDDYIKHALHKLSLHSHSYRVNGVSKHRSRTTSRRHSKKYYYTLIDYLNQITESEWLELVSK